MPLQVFLVLSTTRQRPGAKHRKDERLHHLSTSLVYRFFWAYGAIYEQ